MNDHNHILKIYAQAGLRTQQDWAMTGREIESGSKSRVDVTHRGAVVSLYTRDQTHIRHSLRVVRD